jgi:hypothetical protein
MWWNRMIANICRKTGLHFEAVYDERGFDGDLRKYIGERGIDFVSHGNADMEHIKGLGEHRGVHIIRDPRDIAVSAYFSHMHSHSVEQWSELQNYRDKLQAMSKEEGLATEIENRKTEFRQIESWNYDQPNILEIRFEDMPDSSYDLVIRVFQHYGLVDDSRYRTRHKLREMALDVVDSIGGTAGSKLTRWIRPDTVSGAEILAMAWQFRFQSLAGGRKAGDENVKSHFRKGRPGDWVNHFTNDHKAQFKALYPNILQQLGYEASNDW